MWRGTAYESGGLLDIGHHINDPALKADIRINRHVACLERPEGGVGGSHIDYPCRTILCDLSEEPPAATVGVTPRLSINEWRHANLALALALASMA